MIRLIWNKLKNFSILPKLLYRYSPVITFFLITEEGHKYKPVVSN